ncbi:DUF1799 domain-containing protein [Comamonas kerstersii]|uniref:DUF1799 domain-containing protein n=1 Tax=Comamonas kerstersii TaxID=225992 RepID=UPI001B32C9BD|nr:DUF1799 domain-containing protein [Comamonas kerstersii]QTW17805.1 DUF1799 domain-containing protein [Comamonas kerstersii]
MAIGRALYAPEPEIAAGFEPEDYEEDPIEVWPEHARAWAFFVESCSTQWRIGMAGPTGLDYTAVLQVIQFDEPDKEQAKELFEQIRLIERGALQAMAEARKSEK